MADRNGTSGIGQGIGVNTGSCAICGAISPLERAHIIPKALGGDSSPDNLITLCASCHRTMGAREFHFANYLASLMDESGNFLSLRTEAVVGGYRADIVAQERWGSLTRPVVVECKAQASLTRDRVAAAIYQLKQAEGLEGRPRLVLALPGKVSPAGMEMLQAAGIELWDGNYIAKAFAAQIANQPNPFFSFQLPRPVEPGPHEKILAAIQACPKGKENWSLYQQLVGQLLKLCFCPPLTSPIGELADHSRVNRRDFILPNPAENGFWRYLQRRYSADYIVVDAKNSAKRITKKDILQIANYLKPQGTGMFALIFSRMGADNGAAHTIREQWLLHKKMIVVLDDLIVESILTDSSAGGSGTPPLEDLIQRFRLSM
jgi:hypothetical protein